MKTARAVLWALSAAALLGSCTGMEGSNGSSSYSWSKGLGIIAIEKYLAK